MTEITHDEWYPRLAARAQGGPSDLSAILALASAGGDLVDFSGGFPDPSLYDTQLLGETASKAIASKPEVAAADASARMADMFGYFVQLRIASLCMRWKASSRASRLLKLHPTSYSKVECSWRPLPLADPHAT